MKLPKELGTLADLRAREKRAFDYSTHWSSHLEDIYEYFLPNRNLFEDTTRGAKKMDKIFDSTAVEAIQQAASKLQENIAPPYKRWATFQPSQVVINDLEANDYGVTAQDIQENLDKQADIVFDYIHRSNFDTQFFEHALDLLVGTGTLRIDEVDDPEMPLVFNAIPQKGIAFEEGPQGNVETHWRRFKVKARDLPRKWQGFQPSEKIKQLIEKKPDTMVDAFEGVIYLVNEKKYVGVLWVGKEDHISWYEDFGKSSPWVTGRYSKTAGEVRGRGPALQVLSDAKTINKIKEMQMQSAALSLAGMYTATDDGVTNPHTFTVSPGVVIPVGSNNSSNPSIRRLDTSADLQLPQFLFSDMAQNIKRCLFNDLRDPTAAVRSATEVAIESRELAKRIGSAFGRLQTEVLIPIIKRVVYILTRRGILQPLELDGRDIEIKFTSPLARQQDAEDILNVQQAMQFVLQNAGPDQSKIAFKLEELGAWVATKSGVPAELVRSESDRAKIIQATAEMKMQGANVETEQPIQQGNTVL